MGEASTLNQRERFLAKSCGRPKKTLFFLGRAVASRRLSGSPCGAPSNGDGPGVVGEDCLRAKPEFCRALNDAKHREEVVDDQLGDGYLFSREIQLSFLSNVNIIAVRDYLIVNIAK